MAAYNKVKDFGLGQHRLALPENDPPKVALPGIKRDKKKRRSIGEKVSNFLHRRPSKTAPSTNDRVSPIIQITNTDTQYGEENRQSPALSRGRSTPGSSLPASPSLHSRVLGRQQLAGSHSSLENILHADYGFKKDGTPVMNRKKLKTNDNNNLIKLTLVSENKDDERHITLTKSKEGLGIHLSSGLPPIIVTFVEPGSTAMAAGVKKNDIIVEVNGKECRTVDDLQMSELLELKSLIQHVPSGFSSVDSTRKVFTTKDSDSYSSSSDSEREYEERSANLNKKKQKRITKGVWNRIKAEGLVDSESESGGSFVNLPITAIESSSSDEEEWLAGKDYSKHSSKVEIDEKEWKRMRQQQELIYKDAPSYMISHSSSANTIQNINRKTPKKGPNKSPLLSVKKKLFKWPFGGNKTPSPVKGSREETPSPPPLINNILPQSSEYNSSSSDSEYGRAPILGQVSVEGEKPSRPTRRSHSMYVMPSKARPPPPVPLPVVGTKKKRSSSTEIPDITVVERSSPLLGVRTGRDRRNIAKARNVRKPTTRQTSSPASSQSSNIPVITVNETPGHHNMKKIISDPGGESSSKKDNPKLRRRSSTTAVGSSAALVEAAVRKRNSLTETETRQEMMTIPNGADDKRRRKHALATPYAIEMQHGATAQIVANAAANKARQKKDKSSLINNDKKPPQDRGFTKVLKENGSGTRMVTSRLKATQPSHPLHKSRSFHGDERGKHEPSWIGLAKNKHEKNIQQYMSGDALHKKGDGTKAGKGIHQIQSYNDYLKSKDTTTANSRKNNVIETKID